MKNKDKVTEEKITFQTSSVGTLDVLNKPEKKDWSGVESTLQEIYDLGYSDGRRGKVGRVIQLDEYGHVSFKD